MVGCDDVTLQYEIEVIEGAPSGLIGAISIPDVALFAFDSDVLTDEGKTAIEDHFDNHYELEQTLRERGKRLELDQVNRSKLEPGQVAYIRQMSPLGLGHAVWCARNLINDEPFAVLLADDMVKNDGPGALAQMVEVHERTGASVIGVEEVPLRKTASYGIVGVQKNPAGHYAIQTMVEKPAPEDAPSNLGIIGRYVLDPAVFRHLHTVGKGSGGEIQLTDGIAAMLEKHPVLALPLEGERYDCGSRHGFIEATIKYAMDHDDIREDMLDHMAGLLRAYGRT